MEKKKKSALLLLFFVYIYVPLVVREEGNKFICYIHVSFQSKEEGSSPAKCFVWRGRSRECGAQVVSEGKNVTHTIRSVEKRRIRWSFSFFFPSLPAKENAARRRIITSSPYCRHSLQSFALLATDATEPEVRARK